MSSLIAITAVDHASDSIVRGTEEMRQLVADILAGGDPGRLHDLLVAGVYSPAWAEAHRAELAARREQISQLPDSWFAGLDGILTCTESLDLRPHLPSIRCPTLVVIAGQDRVMPGERSRALAMGIAGAAIVEHPTSGHALVVEDPAWLAQTCLDFLARASQDPS